VALRLVSYDPVDVRSLLLFSGQVVGTDPSTSIAGLPPPLLAEGVLAEAVIAQVEEGLDVLSCNCPTRAPNDLAGRDLLDAIVAHLALPG
jgi:hypothetical protein